MGLGDPRAWWFALLALPVIALYILRVRLRRAPVATTLFWEQVFEERRPRAFWRRLRHPLSLLAQLLFLALLLSAILDPTLDLPGLEARRVVFVLDDSASMQATDVEPSRFESARTQLREQIRGLGARDAAALVTASSPPRVHCGLTVHRRTLLDALDAVEVRDGATAVVEAVQLARGILGTAERTRIVVLSDGGFPDAAALADDEQVVLQRIGESAENTAITRFQVRRSLLDPLGLEVLLEVAHFGAEPRDVIVDLELDDVPLDALPLHLKPGERVVRTLEKTAMRGGVLHARLRESDALTVDDQARALLPYRSTVQVALLGEPSLFLREVLNTNPVVRLHESADVESIPVGADAVFFHQRLPAELPPGPVFVVDPQGDCDVFEVGDAIAQPLVDQQDHATPLMAHVDLADLFLPSARGIRALLPSRALATTLAGEAIYTAIDRPQGSVLVLGVDLLHGDLPLRTAFPILVDNALAHFSGTTGELMESVATAESIEVSLDALGISSLHSDATPRADSNPERGTAVPLHGAELVLRAPDGGSSVFRARHGMVRVGPFERAGIWMLERASESDAPSQDPADAESERRAIPLAVNATDAEESDLRDHGTAPSEPRVDSAGMLGRPLWFLLALGALLFSTLEWWLVQRRRLE